MKKIKNIVIFICFTLIIFNLNISTVKGEDSGYYIKNMNVDVNANDKREYKITETISVYFNEEKHGIIRKIPLSSSLEDYKIKNITVDGAPFTKSEDDYLELKIGDEDETLEGDKTYVISYTLQHYDDEQPSADYIYLNILGDQWDTYIENFTSTITYPENSTLENITITDGEYGSTKSTLVNCHNKNNQIFISSKNKINANNGITLNAKLNEGTFKNAPKRFYPYTVKKDIFNIEITKEKKYIINRHFVVKNNKNLTSTQNHIFIWSDDNNDYIKDVNISNKEVSFDTKNNTLVLPLDKGTYEFDVNYTIEPPLPNDITFFLENNNLGKTENLDVNIKSPYTINNYSVDMKEFGLNSESKRYEVNKNDKVIHLKNLNSINMKEKINLTLDINNSLFSRPTLLIYYITYAVTIITFILILLTYLKNKDSNFPISSVEFYPPNDLNPPELAYVYKESVHSDDIVSLIFYWASDGHIKIHMGKNDNFTLTKLSKLDKKHKSYEKSVFNQLFQQGNNNIVNNKDLEDAYLDSISSATDDIRNFYRKEKPIIDKSSFKKSNFIIFFTLISMTIAFIYNSIFTHTSLILNIMLGIILTIILYLISKICISICKNRYIHNGKKKSTISIIIFSLIWSFIYLIFTAFTELPGSIIFILFLCSLASLIFSSYLPHRSDYGKDMLSKIIGFRDFINVAEKDRLEALLEEDPDYFYKTLPYAQVLGVTKKWINKFKDISMKNPDYIDSAYPMSPIYMSSFMHSFDSINDTVTSSSHAPSDSGGGFDGGGFSGGGSGGGGGSSW